MADLIDIDAHVCGPTVPIREALARINVVSPQLFQIVTDTDGRVVGTVTDGDIRRAMLAGKDLDSLVSEAMHTPPVVGHLGSDAENKEKLKGAKFLPVVEGNGVLHSILLDAPGEQEVRHALVMAGGFGKRLGDRTQNTPKPLLTVGGRPILGRVLSQLEDAGITSIDIAVHYLAEQVHAFVEARNNVADISLIQESQPMGTAGAIGLIQRRRNEPIFVVNGDLVCRVDFRALNDFHAKHGNDGTVAVAQYEVSVPYGVVECGRDGAFTGIQEKPVFNHFVAAGIYCLSPAYLALVSGESPLDMPDLLARGRQVGLQAGLFPIHEYWKDVGQPSDLENAQADHSELDSDPDSDRGVLA